jgi:class 3 adenylate cyclase
LETRGAQQPLTLGFVDPELERQYQLDAGRESLNGLRTIAIASGVVWALATVLLPATTNLDDAFAIAVGLAMSAAGFAVAAISGWANTLDRQHALAMILTSANGIVILTLALVGGVLPGYGVAATTLLFAWGFVARTRFLYAALRTSVIAVGFVVAVELYTGPYNLALDVLLFGAAAVGTLLALRILESNRRRLYFQDLVIHEQTQQLQEESAKSERLILNILPASIAARLRNGEESIADEYPLVSVLFADIVGFTPVAARLEPRELVEMLSGLFSAFDDLVTDLGLEKIKTIGDSYMAVGGLTGEATDQAVNAVRLGLAMIEEADRRPFLDQPLRLRIGIHSGPVVGGVIGTRKLAFDLWGDTVNVASRLEGLSKPSRILVSEATWKLVNHRFQCEAQAESELRGHSTMRTYSILGPRPVSAPADALPS